MLKKNPSSESLNLLLRRIDGRFLSTSPYPKKTICFADGELADAVELISDTAVHSNTDSDSCELAVAVDPDKHRLDAAWSALCPGGSFYIEWNVNRFVNPKKILNELKASGYEDIALYMPKPPPNLSSSKQWIPLEAKYVIAFWGSMEFSHTSGKGSKTIGIFLRRTFAKLFSGLFKIIPGLLYPALDNFTICSIARKPIRDESQNRLTDETSHLRNQIKSDNTVIEYSETDFQSSYKLMMTEGWTERNKAILYLFSKDAKDPSSIVKMSRIAILTKTLANEAKTLEFLEEKYTKTDVIPKLLFTKNENGYVYIGQNYLKGQTLEKIVNKSNFRELSLKATDFLIELDTATRSKTPQNWNDGLIMPILTKFFASYKNVLTPNLIKKTSDLLTDIELSHLVCTHGDYSEWNIVIKSDGQLAVIDWEYGDIDGFPGTDLIHFLAHFSFALKRPWEGSSYGECYRDLLDETTDIGGVYKECVKYYCDSIGIPLSTIPQLRLLLWIIVLNRRYDGLVIAENGIPSTKSLRALMHYEILEEDLNTF